MKTRFPPSPTGFLHIGSLRTALFNYLLAKKEGGSFVLRIEDTDRERMVEGGVENIISTLEWAGLHVNEGPFIAKDGSIKQKGDNGPYIQSERLDIYKKYVQELLDAGHAYYAFDTSEALDEMRKRQQVSKLPTAYERDSMDNQLVIGDEEAKKRVDAGEKYVIRLKVPREGETTYTDLIRGDITFQNKEIDDQVLMKSDGFPTYHLAVVIDDYLMGVTHISRGEEWLSSTPKHVMLYNMFGWNIPVYAHQPLLVNEKKQKLSKRHGDVSVEDFIEKGYLLEALINFVAFLGWNPGTDKEIYSLKELEKDFDITKMSKSSAVFNREKLNWYNKQYLSSMPLDEVTTRAMPFFCNMGLLPCSVEKGTKEFEEIAKAIDLERGRVDTLAELPQAVGFIFANELSYDAGLLVWKKSTKEDAKNKLMEVKEFLEKIDEKDWTAGRLQDLTLEWIKARGYGNGDVLWPTRVALSGQKNSPGPFDIAGVLGKEKTLVRIENAVNALS